MTRCGVSREPSGEGTGPTACAEGSGPGTWRRALLVLLSLAALVGCASSGGSGGHASVRITGHQLEEIRAVAKSVFTQAGYALTGNQPESMTFQRLGTVGDAVLYGGWGGDEVATRVRVRFESIEVTDWRLVATVFTIRDAGDRLMEEESRKLVLNRHPYKKLLNDIKTRIEATP